MPTDLDELDLRVLRELELDSRQQIAALSRKLDTPKATVRYRISRLHEKGIIKGFQVVIDRALLGYTLRKCSLRLLTPAEKHVAEIVKFLTSQVNVPWVAETLGHYDIIFSMHTLSIVEVRDLLDEVSKKFGSIIRDSLLSTNITRYNLGRGYLSESVEHDVEASKDDFIDSIDAQLVSLDKIDEFILFCLSQNCRISSSEISRHIKDAPGKLKAVTPETVMQRIQRLEDEGVIFDYSLKMDLEKINRVSCKVMVRLKESHKKTRKVLLDAAVKVPECFQFIDAMGVWWDCEMNLEVTDISEAKKIVAEVYANNPSLIADYEILLITKEHKNRYFPELRDVQDKIKIDIAL